MKVTIVTFDDSIKHLPIAVYGEHLDAVWHLQDHYDFGELELKPHPSLDYLAFVNSNRLPEDLPLARLNIVTVQTRDGREPGTFYRQF